MSSDCDTRLTIFREYIGVKLLPKLDHFPDDIINPKISEFHFILGIAREDYVHGKGTGHFKITWDNKYFSPSVVKLLKDRYKDQVKVIISIGGHGSEHPFGPKEESLWCTKAFQSIKRIIQSYQVKDHFHQLHNLIDGIDINYNHIESSMEVFSNCIGDLINQLKKDADLSINSASIAPTILVQTHYHRLYWDNRNTIDYIDYQFYKETVSTKEEFVDLYNKITSQYYDKKLLAGVSTDPQDANKISRDVFTAGLKQLVETSSVLGAFVWNANDSIVPPSDDHEPFFLEKEIQEILTKT